MNVDDDNEMPLPPTPGTSLFTGTTNNDNDDVWAPPGTTGTMNGGLKTQARLEPRYVIFLNFFLLY